MAMQKTENWHKSTASAVPAMIGAAALIAMTSILAKYLSVEARYQAALHPMQVSFGRFVFAFLTLMALLCVFPRSRPDFIGTDWLLHFLRAVCGWSGVTAMFAAVAQIPVAEATAISFLSPIVTLALAAVLLHEHVGYERCLRRCLRCSGQS